MIENTLFRVSYTIATYSYSSPEYDINYYIESALEFLGETTLGNLILWLIIFISLSFGFKYFIKEKFERNPGMAKLYTISFAIFSFMGALYLAYYLAINPIKTLGSLFILTLGAASLIILHNFLNKIFDLESSKGIKLLVLSIMISFLTAPLEGFAPLAVVIILEFIGFLILIIGMLLFIYDASKQNIAAYIFTSFLLFVIAYGIYSVMPSIATLMVLGGIGIISVFIGLYMIWKWKEEAGEVLRESKKFIRGTYSTVKKWASKCKGIIESAESKIEKSKEHLDEANKGIQKIERALEHKLPSEKNMKEVKRICEKEVLKNLENAIKEFSEGVNLLQNVLNNLSQCIRDKNLQNSLTQIFTQLETIKEDINNILKCEESIKTKVARSSVEEFSKQLQSFLNELKKISNKLNENIRNVRPLNKKVKSISNILLKPIASIKKKAGSLLKLFKKDTQLIILETENIENYLKEAVQGAKQIKKILGKDKQIKKILRRYEKKHRPISLRHIIEINLSDNEINEIRSIYTRILENVKSAIEELFKEIKRGLEKFVEDLQKGEENKKLTGKLNIINKELDKISKDVLENLRLVKIEEKEIIQTPIESFLIYFEYNLEILKKVLNRLNKEVLQEMNILKDLVEIIEEQEFREILSKYSQTIYGRLKNIRKTIEELIKNMKEIQESTKAYINWYKSITNKYLFIDKTLLDILTIIQLDISNFYEKGIKNIYNILQKKNVLNKNDIKYIIKIYKDAILRDLEDVIKRFSQKIKYIPIDLNLDKDIENILNDIKQLEKISTDSSKFSKEFRNKLSNLYETLNRFRNCLDTLEKTLIETYRETLLYDDEKYKEIINKIWYIKGTITRINKKIREIQEMLKKKKVV